MSIKSGYFKKHLYIDLGTGQCKKLDIPDSFLKKYIGGRGFAAKLIFDNLKKHDYKIDPLGPENLLVVAPGPLTGAYLPSSGKNTFAAISPATGLYGDSSIGGGFGVELRQCGIDTLSITGKADQLSILFIDNDETTIMPFPELKGKTCLETEGMIEEKLGTHNIRVATIGVAGENLVRFACINSDWSRNAGRTGMGAIMGSKNLKAIVVRGSFDLPVFNLKALVEETNKATKYMRNHQYFRLWQKQGLMNVIEYANSKGILPTYNFKDSTFKQHAKINGDVMLNKHKIGDSACFGCPMCCGNICIVKNGKYAGTVTEGPEYESAAMLGSNVGIDDFSAILEANRLCDELGIDTISTGNLIGAVIEGYQNGALSLKDLDNEEIDWGHDDAILRLVKKIARREGIGNTLAEGSKTVIQRWPAMKKIILQVKGLEQSAYDSRAGASMGLAYATSDIGAHHTRAWTIAKEIEEGEKWNDEERVDTVIYHQSLRPLFDMLGVCRLPWIELGLNERHYEHFYNAVTGSEQTLESLLKSSDDIYNLTRLINTKLGMSKKDDALPYKVSNCPPKTGPNAGKTIDEKSFNDLLALYYKKRNWTQQGKLTKETEKRFESESSLL